MRITMFLLIIAIKILENFTYQCDNPFNFINKHVFVNMYFRQGNFLFVERCNGRRNNDAAGMILSELLTWADNRVKITLRHSFGQNAVHSFLVHRLKYPN